MAAKVDFKKTLDSYQARAGVFRLLDMPPTRYLMVDGHGDPNVSPAYTEAVESLYPVAYRLKFASKALGRDYVVPPLEGLWWAEDMDDFTRTREKSRWDWTMMLMVPEWIDEATYADVAGDTQVRLEWLHEGTCVQTLHLGPYDDEAGVLAEMHEEFIPGQGLRLTGKHHEIYLSDPRRAAPEKLRTILRQPVSRATTSPAAAR